MALCNFVQVLLCVFCLFQQMQFGNSVDSDYSCCVSHFLGFNASSCQSDHSFLMLSGILHCDSTTGLSLLDDYCITSSQDTGIIEIGQCMYNHGKGENFMNYIPIPRYNTSEAINNYTCGSYGRNGTLCGKCKNDNSPFTLSLNMNCVECPSSDLNWLKLILAAFLPLTVIYCFVLLFKVNITSSFLQGFVFFSQVVSMPALARTVLIGTQEQYFRVLYRIIAGLCAIWNLDMLRFINLGICLEVNSLTKLALELVLGLYLLLLLMLTYIFITLYDKNYRILTIPCKPFQRLFMFFGKNWDSKTTLIDAFSTFFLLSNVKILCASFDLLAPVKVYQLNESGHLTHSLRLNYDATVSYFERTHLPYALEAIAASTIFGILPLLLFILYPFRCFQKFLNIFPFRWYILHTFMDSFQGFYKDGTEPGTHDYRWYSSTFFILRFALFLVGFFTLGSSYFVLAPIVLILATVVLVQFQPYKEERKGQTYVFITFCLLLALNHLGLLGAIVVQSRHIDETTTAFFHGIYLASMMICVVYMTVMSLHWICSHSVELLNRIKAKLSGYFEL